MAEADPIILLKTRRGEEIPFDLIDVREAVLEGMDEVHFRDECAARKIALCSGDGDCCNRKHLDDGDEELRNIIVEDELVALSRAIRDGDRVEAELMLDRIFDDPVCLEWIAKGRYGSRPRRAVA